MEIESTETPMLIVRNIIIFPYMIIPLNVGRDFSIKAVEHSLKKDSQIAVFSQKKVEKADNITKDDINNFGVIANIIKMIRNPDGTLKILIEATNRIELGEFNLDNDVSTGIIKELKEKIDVGDEKEIEALHKLAKSKFEKCLNRGLNITPEIISPQVDVEDPARLADIIVAQLDIELKEKYKALAELNVKKRLEYTNEYLNKEFDILEIKNRIQGKIKKGMDETQKEYFLREQLKAIQDELGIQMENEDELDEYREQLKKPNKFPEKVQEIINKEIIKLEKTPFDSSEAGVIRNYIEFLLELPWKEYSRSNLDLKRAQKVLDDTHYGLKEVKERILEYLSVKKVSKKLKTPILCFVGPPGVGKTSIGKAIAEAMKRKFIRISLGGMRDEAEIRGHRRTYVGALPGRILRGIQQVGKANPVFMLDEIDKLGNDFRGDPSSAMLEVLDPEQNNDFVDHYLEIGYDLSKVFFITTANSMANVPPALRDRMEVITIPGYTVNEKEIIAKKYLIPRQKEQNGIKGNKIEIMDSGLQKIVLNYTREAGVRNLEREIGKVFRKLTKKILMKEKYLEKIDEKNVEEYLGVPKYEMQERNSHHEVGVATGLAWTEFGGEILNIEVVMVNGAGKLILTGKLGETMQESAQTAFTYTRTIINEYNGDKKFHKNYDFHIHVPEGAVPKDGPSAGITLATAICSKLKNKKVSNEIAMTGEITLTGRVLPIGGLKEKLLAAKLRGMKKVLIPEKNIKDLKEIAEEIKSGLEIIPVDNMDKVLKEVEIIS